MIGDRQAAAFDKLFLFIIVDRQAAAFDRQITAFLFHLQKY